MQTIKQTGVKLSLCAQCEGDKTAFPSFDSYLKCTRVFEVACMGQDVQGFAVLINQVLNYVTNSKKYNYNTVFSQCLTCCNYIT